MPKTKLVTISDSDNDVLRSMVQKYRELWARPVTEIEILQRAIAIGLEALKRGWK
ncbi:MAG: hypothetical protein QW429_04950 [Thermoprotei archaeon]